MAANNFVSTPELVMKADVLSTDASFKLQNINWYTGSDGVVVPLTSGAFGSSGVGFGVFDERTPSQEFFTWDTSTLANATTSGITILSRGLPWGSDYTTEATSRKFFHASGSKVLLYTNSPAFYNTFANKENAETITGKWVVPTYTASDIHQVASIEYANALAIAGASDASTTVKGISQIATGAQLAASTGTGSTGAVLVAAGSSFKNTSAGAGDANKVPVLNGSGLLDSSFIGNISKTAAELQVTTDATNANDAVRYSKAQSMVSQGEATGTSGEAFSVGQALYVKASDSRLYKAVGTSDEPTFSFVGIALDAAGGAGTAGIRFAKPGGIATGLSGLTAGSYYYVTDTAGTIGTTPGTRFAKVGQALSTTTLRVCEPKFVVSGSQTVSSATTYTQTTGFYPARIIVTAGLGNSGVSMGVDNNCTYASLTSAGNTGGDGTGNAWYVRDANTNTTGSIGTISSKTATGFVLTCGTYKTSTVVNWTAYSE